MPETASVAEITRPSRLEIALKPNVPDARGRGVAAAMRAHLGLAVRAVRTLDILTVDAALTREELERARAEFTDPVIQQSATGRVEDPGDFDWMIVVGFKPGVTDNVGRTALGALGRILGRQPAPDEAVHTATAYLIEGGGLTREQARHVALDLLANPLIETIEVVSHDEWRAGAPQVGVPRFPGGGGARVERIDLSGGDEDLERISREGTLSLSLAEMHAIRDYFRRQAAGDPARRAAGLDERPTDVELEMLAQTWSEHCKHKIFSGTIHYTDEHGKTRTIKSLFKTYIKATTDEVAKRVPWLVSVFHDNAGVIAFNDRLDLVYKVETHNSPSALEPYGGAMTGIVGCNRDPLGTGMGAELLINVWGYCFASPSTPESAVPNGVMRPRRLRDGVHKGVIDGGNQSGIPYGVGWEFFDPRYMAKPMVYCGTVGLLPKRLPDGRPAAEKRARAGDLVVMVGGRIGKDGIHGATFSSVELHKDSPTQAVQIGDPITQKKMSDFLIEARDLGYFNAITDNGAGGLSSSVGEMAGGPGGAEIDLARAPLKYAGLQPWEIWLSEAQERMTLAVPPDKVGALQSLAARREVEVTVLGHFTPSGFILLKYVDETVGRIGLEFLHHGYPEMMMRAQWKPPAFAEPALPKRDDLTPDLRDLMARLNIASKETKSRQYDHEVKGRTILKPFVGVRRDVPSDATVFLAEYGGREGIILSYGFNSHYSDLDTYRMMTAIVDLAVRRILAVGGRLDFIAGLDNFCWPDPIESPSTPDGPYKLAQLVRACQGLYDICTAYGVPLISGKDSMKNDSTRGGRKISVPPSVLFSAIGKIDDIGRAITMEAKAPGDLVYVLGFTRAELGGSEYAHLLHDRATDPALDPMSPRTVGGAIPRVDPQSTLALYRAVEAAARAGLFRSLHAVGLGGLAAAFSMVAMGGEFGMEIDLKQVPAEGKPGAAEILFSESAGRFVATIAAEGRAALERALAGLPFAPVGLVTVSPRLVLRAGGPKPLIQEDVPKLKEIWKAPLGNL
jgi:phosphoribosylformylglycinamidine synthase